MNPQRVAELISLLCAKTHAWEPAIRTFNVLCANDISLALGLVQSIPARMLIRIKYADQTCYTGTFENELVSAIERATLFSVEHIAKKWKVPRKDFIRDMCRLALIEHLSPHVCQRCNGQTGAVTKTGQWEACTKCAGTGRFRLSGRRRARMLRIDEKAYRQSWKDRYTAIQELLDRYEEIGLGGVAKRLSN